MSEGEHPAAGPVYVRPAASGTPSRGRRSLLLACTLAAVLLLVFAMSAWSSHDDRDRPEAGGWVVEWESPGRVERDLLPGRAQRTARLDRRDHRPDVGSSDR